MKISTQVNYAGDMKGTVDQVVALEKGGLDVAWANAGRGLERVA